MGNPNTLFILAKWGLKRGDKKGELESHMWLLDKDQESMKYVSLHKTKADRATKGGKIIEIRTASDEEVRAHQDLMIKNGKDLMQDVEDRKIIVFRVDTKWNVIWPLDRRSNPNTYQSIGYVPCPS